MLNQSFVGRSALITGGASGIGKAVAQQLASYGIAKLILLDRSADGLAQTARELTAPSRSVVTIVGDVSGEPTWTEVDAHLAGLDFAVLNAGVSTAHPIVRLEFNEWRRVMGVNLDGVFLGLRSSMKAMRANEKRGAIVVTGSSAGIKTGIGLAAYGTSKAAAHHLVRIAAKEGTDAGIRVNAIAPGGVATPMWCDVPSFQTLVQKVGSEQAAFDEMARAGTPLGKYTSADEIAGQILFLLSDACSTVTGEIFLNDGGFTL
ncbi:MAG: SDR family oxidoreductase [Steroidobacteraceae bacterium]